MKNLTVLSLSLIVISLTISGAGAASRDNVREPLQFTAGDHVIAFTPECLYLTGSDHMLKATFQNANITVPETDQSQLMEKGTQPLEKVVYPELWNGITLAYENKGSGIAKSTYTVSPHADVGQISLVYNVPVRLNNHGKLEFKFETGTLSETAPIAWQIIHDERVAVDAEFCQHKEQTVGFKIDKYNPAYALVIDPVWEWNTFMGSSSTDEGYGIAVDNSGNVYVTGYSGATWGSPVNPHAGWIDAFAAKFNSSGVLQWNTFMGGEMYDDYGKGIAVDDSGNVYVTGRSGETWGSPVIDHAGGIFDAFAAKLNSSGVLQWNTFMGSSAGDYGNGIVVDDSGNVYVAGESRATWGSPVDDYAGGSYDAFAVKLNKSGVLQWNTFMGSSGIDYGNGITVDDSGNVYVTGLGRYSWGSPVNPYAGIGGDAFAQKLNSSGVRQWNTFMGSASITSDEGKGIAVDDSGNVYVTGNSYETWCTPVNPHSGWYDAFATKLNSSGARQWVTFMGSSYDDHGNSIAVDDSGNVYVTGESDTTWGSPVNPFTGGKDYSDAYAVKLNSSGVRQWNTFMGGSGWDYGNSIVLNGNGNVYVAGTTYASSWGTPVNPHAGWGYDAFAVKIDQSNMTGVETDLDLPTEFQLSQNYPNPFNALTWIKYTLPHTNHVTLTVYNLLGKEVTTLVDQFQTEGHHTVAFDAGQLSSGIYLYKLNFGNNTSEMKKMMLIK